MRGLVWLTLVLAATAVMVALATSVAQAHVDNGCIERETNGPPGRYLLYADTSHDHLVAKDGAGVSGISIADSPNNFDYVGHDVTVRESQNVFTIT